MGAEYRHEALATPTSIRLFHLEAGSFEDPLRGTITVTDLESHPNYEAVSYVWGLQLGKPTVAISTDHGSRDIEVTQNLVSALRRFRATDSTRTLWIDSICIAQDNLDEKNQQVPLMGAIYRQAESVLIWLGEDPASKKPALIDHCMWKLHDAIDAIEELEDKELHGLPDKFYRAYHLKAHNPDEIHRSLGIPLLDSPEFQAFQDLLRNPWFVRAWTWQESHVANDRVFQRGDQSWRGREPIVTAVIAIFVLRNVTGLTERYAYENKFAMDMIGNEKFWREQTEYLDFRQVLKSRRGSGCKYASDLIYCLLAGARHCPDIQVEYNKSFESVFTECTWKLILQFQDFEILRDIERDRWPSNLPSWVPDWRQRTQGRSDLLGVSTAIKYRAAGSSHPIVELSQDEQVLTASGIVFDQVWKTEPAEDSYLEFKIAAIFGGEKAMIESYDSTEEILLHAMQRTWFADTMAWADNRGYLKRWTTGAMEQYDEVWDNRDADEQSTLRYGRMRQASTSKRYRRSAFVTTRGQIGIAANTIQPGDTIAFLMGGDMPFILHPLDQEDNYTLVADCYIHGYMDGKALIRARTEADPEWDPEDETWLEQLHESDLPFPVRKFHIH